MKHIIRTSIPVYTIENRKVTCMISASLVLVNDSKNEKIVYRTNGQGVAVCDKEDKFDISKGVKLATARAENSYHSKINKRILQLYASINVSSNNLIKLSNTILEQIKHNEEYINNLIK